MASAFKAILGSTLLGSLQLSQVEAVSRNSYFKNSISPACSGSDRYCVNSLFNNEWSKFDLEFMEGDTPQAMFGMWWKEICDSSVTSTCAPEKTCGGTTGEPITGSVRSTYFPDSQYTFDNEGCYYDHTATPAVPFLPIDRNRVATAYKMFRFRRQWQFPGFSFTNPLPSDVANFEVQTIYASSDSIIVANYGWMMGDVGPLNSCAYVVSQSTVGDGSTLAIKYNFEQWVMSIKANDVLQQRQVQLR